MKISVNLGGGANELSWMEKIENLVIDPPTIRDERLHYNSRCNKEKVTHMLNVLLCK